MNREVPAELPAGLNGPGGEYPYGQSWDGFDELKDELEEPEGERESEPASAHPLDDELFFGFDDDGPDDEELLAALDEALDEVEAEARVEYARSLACPEDDALELTPMADTAYRSAISAFLGEREPPRAPRYTQLVRTYAVRDPELGTLLQVNLHRSRANVERRRADICWVA